MELIESNESYVLPPWDNEVRSPFDATGIAVKEGDYILAVNGVPVDTKIDPYASLEGMAGNTVILKVNSKPIDGRSERCIDRNIDHGAGTSFASFGMDRSLTGKKWTQLSNGDLGYMYMPNTGGDGQTELMRQFYAQIDKKGFIIDERFNAGGQLGDRFVEMLNRPNLYNIAWRNAGISRIPGKGNNGPKAMLINGWAGSGGDAFPWAFKIDEYGSDHW